MALQDTIKQLVSVFCNLYPDKGRAARVCTYAKLTLANINFDQAAAQIWFCALSEATNEGKVGDLFDVARKEYPGDLALQTAHASWRSINAKPLSDMLHTARKELMGFANRHPPSATVLKDLYEGCLYGPFCDELPKTIETLEDAIDHLIEIAQKWTTLAMLPPGALPPLIVFIELWARTLGEPHATALRNWNTSHGSTLCPALREEEIESYRVYLDGHATEVESNTSRFMFVVDFDSQLIDNWRLYRLETWFWARQMKIAIRHSETLGGIEDLAGVRKEIGKILREWESQKKEHERLVVEIFAPNSVLLDIQPHLIVWESDEEGRVEFCRRYIFLARSLNRIRKVEDDNNEHLPNRNEWEARWRVLWEKVAETPVRKATRWLGRSEINDTVSCIKVSDEIEDENPRITYCLGILNIPDSSHFLNLASRRGIPVVIWRRTGDPGKTKTHLNQAIGSQVLLGLPAHLRHLRSHPHSVGELELLWDDPFRIPPPYVYTGRRPTTLRPPI